MQHSECVKKCMSIYNRLHSKKDSFPSTNACFNYYQRLHNEYLQLVEDMKVCYFKDNVEDGIFFAEKCITFYDINLEKNELTISYVYVYLFWNCFDTLECDCVKLCLLLIPIILFQKTLFYHIIESPKKYASLIRFRDSLKDIYEIVLKGERKQNKCGYMTTLLSNTLTKIKRLDNAIQSVNKETKLVN